MKYWLYRNTNIFSQTDSQEVKSKANPDVFEETREIDHFPITWQPCEIFTFIALLKLRTYDFNIVRNSRHLTDAINWIIENEILALSE